VALYFVQGRGAGTSRIIWNPGDLGLPNRADTKEELLSSCPEPESFPCPADGCDQARYVYPRQDTRTRYWVWLRMGFCLRCQHLHNDHGLKLSELRALWESQDRRCFRCSKTLPDPQIIIAGVRGKGRRAQIDHDHTICPKPRHSCQRCRRGLACTACNSWDLSIRTGGFWIPPEGDELHRWLEFLGPAGRDSIRVALTLFPEQPARRSRSRQPGEAAVIPLFGRDAC
jgi:hypothetical protein